MLISGAQLVDGMALVFKIQDSLTFDTLQGRAYALNAARHAMIESRRQRLQGNAHQAQHYARQAAGYRAEVGRVTEIARLTGRDVIDSTIDWSASATPVAWRDHTSATSRERAVRVERARQAYRRTLSGRHV